MLANLLFYTNKIARFAGYRLKLTGGIRTLITLIILPALILLALGQILQESADPANIPVVAVDLDRSEYSQTVLNRLKENPSLDLLVLDFDGNRNQNNIGNKAVEEARNLVITGKKEVAYIFHNGFMESILAGEYEKIITVLDSPSSLLTELLGETVAGEIIRLTANVTAANKVLESLAAHRQYITEEPSQPESAEETWEKAWSYADSLWEPRAIVQLNVIDPTRHNDTEPPINGSTALTDTTASPETALWERHRANNLLFILAILSVLIMLMAIFLNSWPLKDRTDGLWPRLKSSAVNISYYIAGNTLTIFALIFISAMLSLWLAANFLPVANPFTAPLLTLLFCYTLAVTGLALLIAAVARNLRQLQVLGIMVTVITVLLAGTRFFLGEDAGFWSLPAAIVPQNLFLAGARELLFSPQGNIAAIYPAAAPLLFTFILLSFITQKVVNRYD